MEMDSARWKAMGRDEIRWRVRCLLVEIEVDGGLTRRNRAAAKSIAVSLPNWPEYRAAYGLKSNFMVKRQWLEALADMAGLV